jgi:uncharacterized membrane protein YhhN
LIHNFLWITLFLAILDWIAVAKDWQRLEFITKPAVMVTLLVWLWQISGFRGQMIWFAVGLTFSLAGDILLMLPKEQFTAGLVAFLMGQLAYLVGFTCSGLPPLNLPTVILVFLVAGTSFQIYRRIAFSQKSSETNKLKLPVFIYTVAISLMLLSALTTLLRSEWQPIHALAVSSGALLFCLSDTLLAFNKFVSPLPHRRVTVIVTYHLGQILITVGAAFHYINMY